MLCKKGLYIIVRASVQQGSTRLRRLRIELYSDSFHAVLALSCGRAKCQYCITTVTVVVYNWKKKWSKKNWKDYFFSKLHCLMPVQLHCHSVICFNSSFLFLVSLKKVYFCHFKIKTNFVLNVRSSSIVGVRGCYSNTWSIMASEPYGGRIREVMADKRLCPHCLLLLSME